MKLFGYDRKTCHPKLSPSVGDTFVDTFLTDKCGFLNEPISGQNLDALLQIINKHFNVFKGFRRAYQILLKNFIYLVCIL